MTCFSSFDLTCTKKCNDILHSSPTLALCSLLITKISFIPLGITCFTDNLTSDNVSNCSYWSLFAGFGVDYERLKKTFLQEGRGRRPDLPEVLCTNRLLLQLTLLQKEGNKTFKDVSLYYTVIDVMANYKQS